MSMVVRPHRREEKKFWKQGLTLVAGVDEVGRGAWAGPIVAAAVILPPKFLAKDCADSKVLSPKKRQEMFVHITRQALSWSVAVVEQDVIDAKGLAYANKLVLTLAVEKLHLKPQAVLVDAFPLSFGKKPVKAIIDGDAKVLSIAAASIVAKVARDELMRAEHRHYPEYKFDAHKGYGTRSHHLMIKKYGPSAIHRMSFRPMNGKPKIVGRAKVR